MSLKSHLDGEDRKAYHLSRRILDYGYHSGIDIVDEYDGSWEEIASDIRSTMKSFPRREVIEFIGMRLNESALIPDIPDSNQNSAGMPPKWIEFCLGLALTIEDWNNEAEFDPLKLELEMIKGLERSQELTKSENEKFEEVQESGRHVIAGEFVIGKQYIEAFVRAYLPFNEKIEELNNFRVEDVAQLVVEAFRVDNKDNLKQHWRLFYHYFYELKSMDFQTAKEQKIPHKLIYHRRKYEEISRETIEYNVDDISEESNLGKETLGDILDRISREPFKDQSFDSPFQINPIESTAITKLDDQNYLVPNHSLVYRALYKTFYYDLIDSDIGSEGEDGGEFGEKWGGFLERWVEDLLQKQYKDRKVSRSVKLGDKEMDVVLELEDSVILFECKTKKIPQKARSGNREQIEESIQKGIGKAWSQLNDFANEASEEKWSDKEIHKAVILSEPYDAHSTGGFTSYVEEEGRPPFVVDIFNLPIVLEVLNGKEIIDYIEKRRKLLASENYSGLDEADMVCGYRSGSLDMMVEMISDKDGVNVQHINSDPTILYNYVDPDQMLVENFRIFLDKKDISLDLLG